MNHWSENHSVLRVRNLASEEGDDRFRKVRADALSPVVSSFARQIRASQDAGRVAKKFSPDGASVALVAMLERVAAYSKDLESRGLSREAMLDTLAGILYQTVTGERAD